MKDIWNKVLDKSRDNNVFLTWENMMNNIGLFEKEVKLRILCVMDESKIVSIAPFKQSNYSMSKLLSYKVVEPLTCRTSDYTGLILAEKELACLRLVLKYLFEHKDWDFIYLYDVPETSIIFDLLPKVKQDFKFEITQGKICPYVLLPNSCDELMQKLSRKFRKNLRRSLRKLQEDCGKVELKEYTEIGSLEETTKIFFNLHQKRWKKKGKSGVFFSQEVCDRTLNSARLFAQKGWLSLYFLTVNDKPIAAQYDLEYNQKMHYWLGGFDPAYSSYSVGSLIVLKVLEDCIGKRIKEYDFMKGDEQYKFNWSREFRRNLNIRFVNDKPTSKLYNLGISTTKKLKISKKFRRFLDF